MISSLVRSAYVLGCVVGASVSMSMAQVQSVQVTGAKLEHQVIKDIAFGDHVRIERLSTPDGVVDLELDRVEVLTPDAQVVVGSVNGMDVLARPDVVVLSGIVAGEANSMAYLAISPYGTNGFIDLHGEITSISTGPYAQEKNLLEALRSSRMSDVLDLENLPSFCGYSDGNAELEPSGSAKVYPPSANRGVPTCRIASIAIETDWEFTDRVFNGNSDAAAAYIVSLMGAISEIYQRDMNVQLTIPYLRVWDDNSDPYSAAGDPLDQVRDHWNGNMGSVSRTVVHYFTGRTDTSYGGVAYLSVLCNSNFGYGVSAYINGSFPYPLVDHNSGNWDVTVASHELGHNFGTGHTHSYSPPIDGCGSGDCAAAFGGTIMSYCHTCSGGMSNLVLAFHPRVQDTILGYMDSIACDLIGQGLTAINDSVETAQDAAIEIDALSNDEAGSCETISYFSHDASSAFGGVVELLAGQGPGGRDIFRFTPAIGFTGDDTFSYTILGDSGMQTAVVTVTVVGLRPADTRIDPIAGLGVQYYSIGALDMLPDFSLLTPIGGDIATSVAFESTGGNFMNSGLSDNVGAVLTGYVWAFQDGIYTFSTESDDGSRLLIGSEVVVDNDGLHGMVRVNGTISLASGWHQITIEFFERGGGAGLISTVSGPGIAETELGGIILSHESGTECSLADLNGDGLLNFFDVSAFLQAFNAGDLIADFNDDGLFNFFDVSAFMIVFSDGCP